MIAIIGTIYEEMIRGKEVGYLGYGGPVLNVIRMSKWLLNNIMMNISSVHLISCIGNMTSSSKLLDFLFKDPFSYIDLQINKLSPRIEYLMNKKDNEEIPEKKEDIPNNYQKLYNRDNPSHCHMNLDVNFVTTGILSKHRYIYMPLELLFESSGPKISLEISKMISWSHPKSAKALIVSLPEINVEQELVDLLPAINSVLIYADFVVGSSKAYHQFAFHCFGDDRMPLKEILKRIAEMPKASTYRPRTLICVDSFETIKNPKNNNNEISSNSNSYFGSSITTFHTHGIERRSTNGLNTASRGISNINNKSYTFADINDVQVYMQIGALELVAIPYDRLQLRKLWMEHEAVITSYKSNTIDNDYIDSDPFVNISISPYSMTGMAKLIGEQIHLFTAGFVTALSLSEYQMEERKRVIDPALNTSSINGSVNSSDNRSKSSRSNTSNHHSDTSRNFDQNSFFKSNLKGEEERNAHILATARGLMQCVQAGQFAALTALREWTRELNKILSNINCNSDIDFNREDGDAYDRRPCSYFQ